MAKFDTSCSIGKSVEELFLCFDDTPDPDIEQRGFKLSWRLDPNESHSDWTIITKKETSGTSSNDGLNTNTYHVHKAVLSVGPNRSEYFVTAFRPDGGFKETTSSTSEISLPGLAFDAFHYMLDFIYGHSQGEESWEETLLGNGSYKELVALRYLSQYFTIRSLFRVVSKAILKDSQCGMIPLLMAAEALHDEKLISLLVDRYARDCDHFDLAALSPPLALNFFESETHRRPPTEKDGLRLSSVVAGYCTYHRNEIDCDFLKRATKYVRDVHYTVSPFLITLSRELDGENGTELDSLRKLCHDGFDEDNGWNEAAMCLFDETEGGDSEEHSELSSLPPSYTDVAENFKTLDDSEKAKLLKGISTTVWSQYKTEKAKCKRLDAKISALYVQSCNTVKRLTDRYKAEKEKCSGLEAKTSQLENDNAMLRQALKATQCGASPTKETRASSSRRTGNRRRAVPFGFQDSSTKK